MRVEILADPSKKGYYRVLPHGSIDSDTHTGFKEKIQPLLNADTRGIVLDLKEIEYISSAGLGVLFLMKKHFMAKGGELVFCNLRPQIKRLFEVVKALPGETVFESLEEADKYFYKIMNEEIEKRKKRP
jgi:anti-sigma B factor antagonist